FVHRLVQKIDQNFPGCLLAKEEDLVRVEFEVGQLKRCAGPSSFQSENARINSQLSPVHRIGLPRPAWLHGLDLLHQRSEPINNAIHATNHAETHFSFYEGALYRHLRTVIAASGLLNPLVPFHSFKSAIRPAKSALSK